MLCENVLINLNQASVILFLSIVDIFRAQIPQLIDQLIYFHDPYKVYYRDFKQY